MKIVFARSTGKNTVARQPDLAFEALERVTHSNRMMERGKLNTALKAIRYAWAQEGGLPEDLPWEIELRAEAYHRKWPGLTLTPTALATHWFRVVAEQSGHQQALNELRREGHDQD
jgi:hypothetical protein